MEHLRQVSKRSDQWYLRRCDNEIVTGLSKRWIAILKMAVVRPYLLTDQNHFFFSHARFRQNSFSTFREDAIMVKIKDGCQRPHLSTDRNHFRAHATRSPGEDLRQVSKKNDQWFRRRCDNEERLRIHGRTYGRTDGRTDWRRMVHYWISSTYR